MTREELESGIALLDGIKEMEDIITRLRSLRIKHVELADGSVIHFLPRGAIKDLITENCRERIEVNEEKISGLGVMSS